MTQPHPEADLVERLRAEAVLWAAASHTVTGPVFASLLSEAADQITSLMEERDAAELFVPGEFCCAKCGFTLSQFTLSASTGQVGSRDHPGEKCPNDGSPLWRVTWKQRASDHYDRATQEIARAEAAEAQLAAMRAALEKSAAHLVMSSEQVQSTLDALVAMPIIAPETLTERRLKIDQASTYIDVVADVLRVARAALSSEPMSGDGQRGAASSGRQ